LKILILSCSTGEGHNSAAKSVISALTAQGVECELVDPIIFKSEKRMKHVAGVYNYVISKMPWLFGFVYKIGGLYDKLPLPSPVAFANSRYAKPLCEYIKKGGYDAVIAVHLFAMQAMVAVRKKLGFNIPTYCVLTDYTVIPFHKDTKLLDWQMVPTENEKKLLLKKGFDEKKIFISGIPANSKFAISITKQEARARLGLPLDKKIVMVLSGGAGCGKMPKLCKRLNRELPSDAYVCVFPGKNEKLANKLKAELSENPRFSVVDFTPDVNLYMKAADVVLSKAGGLSSTEVAVANVPFVHLREIPGCETSNIRYFTQNGISIPGRSVKSAVKSTLYLLSDNAAAERMLAIQRELIPKNSAEIIANKVIGDLKDKK